MCAGIPIKDLRGLVRVEDEAGVVAAQHGHDAQTQPRGVAAHQVGGLQQQLSLHQTQLIQQLRDGDTRAWLLLLPAHSFARTIIHCRTAFLPEVSTNRISVIAIKCRNSSCSWGNPNNKSQTVFLKDNLMAAMHHLAVRYTTVTVYEVLPSMLSTLGGLGNVCQVKAMCNIVLCGCLGLCTWMAKSMRPLMFSEYSMRSKMNWMCWTRGRW